MPSPSRSGTHRQVPGPFLCSPACSRPISFHVCLSVSKWPLVSTPVSWPLLGAISLTFLDSSPSVSRGPFIYRRHYVLVPLCPPFSLCHLLLPSSLSLAVLSPSVSPPPSFPCLSVSLKHSHLAQESNTAGLFFFPFHILDTAGRGAERMTDVCTSLWVSHAGGTSAHGHHLLLPASHPAPGGPALLSKLTPFLWAWQPLSRKASLMLLRPLTHPQALAPAGLAGSPQVGWAQRNPPLSGQSATRERSS